MYSNITNVYFAMKYAYLFSYNTEISFEVKMQRKKTVMNYFSVRKHS